MLEKVSGVRLALVADDLTGACDAAVAFADRGIPTRVMLDWHGFGDMGNGVVAISTESRDIDPADSEERLREVAGRLKEISFQHVFKKIDSVFRGNTIPEIRMAVQEFPPELTIIAPAYPAVGRISEDGVLRIRDISGERLMPVHDDLLAAGVVAHRIGAGLKRAEILEEIHRALDVGKRVVYCDAVSGEDLAAIAAAGRESGRHVLWVGSAGIAHALAQELAQASAGGASIKKARPGRVIFFVGSDHPVTRAQMAALDEIKPSERMEHRIVRVERGVTPEVEIRAAVQEIEAKDVGCLFMTGGDTAMQVCRALGIASLELHHEFEPGLPCGIAEGGRMAGARIILKSGGFGRPDVLCRIAEKFSARR